VKIIGYIAVGSVVIVASLFCLLCSTCAASSYGTTSDRVIFSLLALLALGVAIGGVMLIGKISREE
jgi:hypothetical protein